MSNEGGNDKIVTYFTYFLLYIRVEGGGYLHTSPDTGYLAGKNTRGETNNNRGKLINMLLILIILNKIGMHEQ